MAKISSFPPFFWLFFAVNLCTGPIYTCGFEDHKEPTLVLALMARNKEHTLPYTLSMIEALTYPKHRISLFLRSDHNIDKTIDILETWLLEIQNQYHKTNIKLDRSSGLYKNEAHGSEWGSERFEHIMKLKEEALGYARDIWADYIFFLDLDVFIIKPDLIQLLINEERAIISPMLKSLATYSNFWGAMTEDYWYARSEDYLNILDRKSRGCFDVPMIHSSVLVDLTRVKSDNLTFIPSKLKNYAGPLDDIITFAISAKVSGLAMTVCNHEIYGYIPPPLEEDESLNADLKQLLSLKLEILVEFPGLSARPRLARYIPEPPEKDRMGFDQIYLISLARRPERRARMFRSFTELGIAVKLFDAVDGKRLNESYLSNLGVRQMGEYKDPWSHRDMTLGEIGCFLSHYNIWLDIVQNGYEKVLLFEDDIRFEPFFREKVMLMRDEADRLLDWDLIYLGRKKMKNYDEPWVEDSETLVHVDYSYWTLCYAITLTGAKKLLAPQPLSQMIPVDEYIPIMFNKHPQEEWMNKFPVRNLNAYSVSPLYVFPTHYTGEEGYISDTEESPIIQDDADGLPIIDGKGTKGLGLKVGLDGLVKDEL